MTEPPVAEIAREVDRLVIGVHRSVFAKHRPQLRALIEPLHVSSPAYLMDLAEFFAVGLCTIEIARLRFRYDPTDAAGDMFDALQRSGLLDHENHPSSELKTLVDAVLAARSQVAASLWGDSLDVALTGCVEAMGRARGPLTDQFRLLPEPAGSAHRLHHLLTGLRYARMDAHTFAWQSVGLDAREIVALSSAAASRLGEAQPSSETGVPERLVSRGWLNAEGHVTDAGRAARTAIEADTNARCAPMFSAVSESKRWHNSLCALNTEARANPGLDA